MKKDMFRRFLKGGVSLLTGAISQNVSSKDGGVGKVDKVGLAGIVTAVGIVVLGVLFATGKIDLNTFIDLFKVINE
jgi:hypothetical protein